MVLVHINLRGIVKRKTRIQLTSAILIVGSQLNCGNLKVFLTDKSKRSMHESLRTDYPRPTHQKELKYITEQLNYRLRKTLGFRTPYEVFFK